MIPLFRRNGRRARHTTVATEYGHVVLDEQQGRYWHLNDSALIIAECLRDGGSRDDAAEALVSTYGVERDDARRDVDAACVELEQVGVL